MITVADLYILSDNIDVETKWYILDVDGSPAHISQSKVAWGSRFEELQNLKQKAVEHWYNENSENEVIVWIK